ncbi:MAG: MBL fold metallo-hydrolase [Acidobacteria bacterium]|nr:MBL fold metallo-hydrolase [Acidobacteriota bacterium]MCI0626653.1 MBL fold metallo-hydrolase [Acidobacteriota bacterium]MCI0717773.1 MBL fold metallo-hydrolase [Acidobacteriota bacterium]
MPNYMCATCGVQFASTLEPPQHCPICEDPRQYVNPNGQNWTTLEELRQTHSNVFKPQEPGLLGIGTEPTFAIGQRALLIQTPSGNVLWDCISLIDGTTVEQIQTLGGLSAIAISHPHFYSAMVEWSHAFGSIPIYLHAANREWVMRPDPVIVFWDSETYSLGEGLTLIHCGGHFPGSAVLHWAAGAEGRGVLLTGDTIFVVPDIRYVTFMYSYPNLIPLPAQAVERILQAVEPFAFDRLYSIWFDRVVVSDAKAVVSRSADRYLQAISKGISE